MSTEKFPVGTRVRVYQSPLIATGSVTGIKENGNLVIDLDCNSADRPVLTTVHPKQCRRLVKKERRRVWIKFFEDGTVGALPYKTLPLLGYTLFVEVRRKK